MNPTEPHRLPSATTTGRCCRCDQPAHRHIGRLEYCEHHTAALLDPIHERVIIAESLDGIGLQAGPFRRDFGIGFANLRCSDCNATWTGRLLEPCPWCERSRARMIVWQAELLLSPELPDAAARHRASALQGWQERLARGVESGLITEPQARTAWNRTTADDRHPSHCTGDQSTETSQARV